MISKQISQISLDEPHFSGPIAYHAHRNEGAPIILSYAANESRDQGHIYSLQLPVAHPPLVTWRIGDNEGFLSPLAFIGLWNEFANEIDGHPLQLDIADNLTLGLAFPALHPSGLFQLIRFRPETQQFHRQILYPIGKTPNKATLTIFQQMEQSVPRT